MLFAVCDLIKEFGIENLLRKERYYHKRESKHI